MLATSALTTAFPFSVLAEPEIAALRETAAARGILFGSNSDQHFAQAPPAYEQLFTRQAALDAANLSWQDIAPTSADPDALHENDSVDPNVAIAIDRGLRITGAHLLWYLRTPAWIDQLTASQAEAAISAHIRRLAGFYRGHVWSWNVLNEVVEPPQQGPDGLRVNSALVRTLGLNNAVQVFATAFKEARAADPQALLLYNEYDVELDVPWQEARRTAVMKLLDKLQAAGAPIDGLGIQSHLKYKQFGNFREARFRKFLEDIAARKLKIVITELDVDDREAPADFAERDRLVADIYARYLAVILDSPAVAAAVTWGLVDPYSWYNSVYFKDYRRDDHLPQRPLLFDADFKPKPSFYATLHALENAPKRRAVNR
ncbi:endo-1,4-beta-xylanase [Terracidiphilus sp.]|jgi:endo-1,4-beta-xylanase|uniref:endo-1,4-beta-xylanase n=1 Tax=Terracidiphilus sp. TaxID=1964191 RepID=UPI003C2899A7